MIQFAVHLIVTAVLLVVVGKMVSGMEVEDASSAVIGVLVLGLANAVIRPILVLLTLPITILTLGLFLWVVNALMLMLAAAVVPGFEVKGFKAALFGSLLLGLLNLGISILFGL